MRSFWSSPHFNTAWHPQSQPAARPTTLGALAPRSAGPSDYRLNRAVPQPTRPLPPAAAIDPTAAIGPPIAQQPDPTAMTGPPAAQPDLAGVIGPPTAKQDVAMMTGPPGYKPDAAAAIGPPTLGRLLN